MWKLVRKCLRLSERSPAVVATSLYFSQPSLTKPTSIGQNCHKMTTNGISSVDLNSLKLNSGILVIKD